MLADIGIAKAFAHKRAFVADVDKRKVHVAYQIIVFPTSPQFSFIQIVDECRLYVVHVAAYGFR